MTPRSSESHGEHFAHAANFARGFAGAIVFGVPLMMTMEMWWLGFALGGLALLQFALVGLVVLVGLSRVSGYDESRGAVEDLLDALAAFGIGAIVSAVTLALFAEIGPETALAEVAGMIVIQAVPASFGAMIADKLFGQAGGKGAHYQLRQSYGGQLILMLSGALFLSFTMSPTEEMALISYRMTPWHALALIVATILLMHALVYSSGFGERSEGRGAGFVSILLRFTIVAYGIAALTSAYILWSFGRLDGLAWEAIAPMVVVLAFPAGLGAAIARLLV